VHYAIRIAPAAERELRLLNKPTQRRILDRIEKLGASPRARGNEKLKGKGTPALYRARVGDYRIIYEIDDKVLVILVLKIGNRRDVYRS
jgi:mRNA interferase RelE/StbE